MRSLSHSERLSYVGGTLLFLVGAHLALNEPGHSLSQVIPLLVIMLWGDLVREFVASRTPGTDDPTLRARRKRWSAFCYAAGALTIAAFVVAMAFDAKPGRIVGYLWIAAFMSLGAAGLGLIVHDSARETARKVVEERKGPPVFFRAMVFALAAALVSYAAWIAWDEWTAHHALPPWRIAGLAILTGTSAYMVYKVWQHSDLWEERAQEYLASPHDQ